MLRKLEMVTGKIYTRREMRSIIKHNQKLLEMLRNNKTISMELLRDLYTSTRYNPVPELDLEVIRDLATSFIFASINDLKSDKYDTLLQKFSNQITK